MDDALVALHRLLESERCAALRADVDTLVELQQSKKDTLSRLSPEHHGDARMTELRSKAAANVQLIRHLVSCLNGILMPPGSTYTAQGRSPASAYGRSRGHL